MAPFRGYLSNAELGRLVQTAVDSDLIETDRKLQLQGIARGFALGLQRAPNPLDQFSLDLNGMNLVERLENGEVPLVQFLQNAAMQLKLRGRKEAEVFERIANGISNASHGVSDLPDPSHLPEITKNEAIVGTDDTVDFTFLAAGAMVGKSVARVLVPRFENGTQIITSRGKPWLMVGTAWLIAPGYLVTNHHVINARLSGESDASQADCALQAQGAIAEFDYDSEDSGQTTQVKIAAVVAVDKTLDFAFLKLQTSPNRSPLVVRNKIVEFGATTYLPVNIIQHPRGKAKRVAFRNNLVTASDADTIRYFTDTDFGSSGSPVCDDQWGVLALHRGAKFVERVNYLGKPTAYVNFGSQICAVLKSLRELNERLYNTIVQSQPDLAVTLPSHDR